MGFPCTGQRNPFFRGLEVLKTLPLKSEGCASSSLDSLLLSALWSYSSVSSTQRVLKHISVFSCSHVSCFISFSLAYLPYWLYHVFTCCLCVDMGFNKVKKKKLADLLSKWRAAAAGAGPSTPVAPSTSATSAPHPTEPAPAIDRQAGVVAIESGDEDTCTSLVFKRQRVGEAVAPSASASGGTLAFIDHPLSASSPLHLVVHEGGGESALEGQEMPSTTQLPVMLQRLFNCFQDKEVLESLSGNLSQYHIIDGLGDFLIASNLAPSRA